MPRKSIKKSLDSKDSSGDLSLLASLNELRNPDDDLKKLLKAIIKSVMDDYIRLQHPSRRDEGGTKEAFQQALAALYDSDWELELPGEVPGSIEKFSFRRILAVRFGIDNISNKEIQNIPLGTLRAELIKEAKEYWCNRKLSVVEPLDFISFAGEAYTVWRVKKGEDCSDDDGNFVDHENKIAYLPEGRDSKATSIAFVRLALEILNYHRSYYYCSEQLDSLSEDLWELLRMNNCFRGEVVKEKEKPSLD